MNTVYKILPTNSLIINGQEVPGTPCSVLREDGSAIPFAVGNIDYANFKKEINEETAQLEDADGKLYTKEQAKVFVSSLP